MAACWTVMSLFDRAHHHHPDSPSGGQRDALTPGESHADAEESAAHIAEMVRRTTERLAAPNPWSAPRSHETAARVPPTPLAPVAQPITKPARPTRRQPSRRTLVATGAVGTVGAVGAIVAVLIGGALASQPVSAQKRPTSPTPASAAPAGYAVKVTDVITDCSSHARGRAKTSFEAENCVKATRSLATGQVSGRRALFVTSRVQMASAEAAASIKQVLDGDGTGNLTDLLREGRTFPGAPDKMPASGYVSVQTAKVVTVAEAGFADGGRSSNNNAALRVAAAQVAALVGAEN